MADKPNLLYIHTDQHSPHVTGCYGDALVETPNLDRLAAQGALFENAYCASPICVPSRMSMLSARHPFENQVWTNEHVLDSGIPTLAHAMGAGGYDPMLIGRMHALGPDQLHGYTARRVGDHGPNYIGGGDVDRGALHGTAGPHRISLERSGPGQSAYQVHDEYVTAAAVDYLNQVGVQRRAGVGRGPFNLTVGYMLPHAPYVARQADYDRYAARMTLPRKPRPFAEEQHPHLRWWRAHTGIEAVSEAEIVRARAAYWALVGQVDAMIGEILHALEANDLLENTLIVYTSDHGDMVGEHGLWWKHVFYEESVRVPLIMAWPGVIAPGQRCTNVVSALDATVTMLDALDAPRLPNASGRSFLGLVDGRQPTIAWEDIAFSEYCSDQFCPDDGCRQRMVRAGDWKLIYDDGQPAQLFNLAEDPDELHDRGQDPAYDDIQRQLTALVLDGWDPAWIAARMAAKKADVGVMRQWAQQTQPTDAHRWRMEPGMNFLAS